MITRDAGGDPIPLDRNCGRAFLYARYNVDLSSNGLAALGFGPGDADPVKVSKMDNATRENIDLLVRIGQAAAQQVDRAHFGPFIN